MTGLVSDFTTRSRELWRAVSLVWQSARFWTCLNLLLILAQAAFPVLALYLVKLIVDAVGAALGAAPGSQAWREPLFYIALAGGLAILRAWTTSLANLARDKQGELVVIHLHHVVHHKSALADLASFEDPEYYNTLHRAQKEVGFRPTSIVNGMVRSLQSGVSFLGVAGLLLAFHWGAFLCVVLLCLPEVLVRIRFARRLYTFQLDNVQEERRAWFYHRLLTTLDFAKELKLFRLSNMFMQRFLDSRRTLYHRKQRIIHRRFLAEGLTQTLALGSVFGVYAMVAMSAMRGEVSLGDLVMYFQAFMQGQQFFQDSVRSLARLYEDNLFLSGLYDILDLEPMVREPESPEPYPAPLRQGVTVDSVSFTYPGSTTPALRDVSLELPPGRLTALVGENGSGKTTLVKLLCRLYDASSGEIQVDSVPLPRLSLEAVRRNTSVVFQDFVRYPATAAENIAFGDISANADPADVARAAALAGVDSLLEGLPQGYETMLTKWLSQGAELSGGEWQKVALARALFGDTPILILDEPTSAMDSRSEFDLYDTLKRIAPNRSILLISHRLTTVKAADYIYVMESGHIVEQGLHPDLMTACGPYHRLFSQQDKSLSS